MHNLLHTVLVCLCFSPIVSFVALAANHQAASAFSNARSRGALHANTAHVAYYVWQLLHVSRT